MSPPLDIWIFEYNDSILEFTNLQSKGGYKINLNSCQ